jgi:CHAP domain
MGAMSLDSALQRVATINQALASTTAAAATLTGGTLAPGSAAPTFGTPTSGGTALAGGAANASDLLTQGETSPAGATPTFASALAQASGIAPANGIAPASAPSAGAGSGAQILAAAESQVGQTEQPPGSNESPAIAQYRSATVGAVPGAPWCAYFASWAARQAGEPLGAQGEGLGSVSEIWSWAQSTGRAIPNGPGVVPKPGDLIVFGGEHVGIVRGVLPNGSIQTVEGNYENKVALNERPPDEATGYVEMG